MATLDLTKTTASVYLYDANLTGFGTVEGGNANAWSFLTPAGHDLELRGSDMTFDAQGRALSGTVTSVTIDLGNNDLNNPDVTITGIAADATTLDDGPESFWRILEGDDVIMLPEATPSTVASGFYIFGDGIADCLGTVTGGNDIITAGDAASYITGDTMHVGSQNPGTAPTVYRGGNDEYLGGVTVSQQFVAGDVAYVHATGRVEGGADTVFIQSSNFGSMAIGDVELVEGIAGDRAEVFGGNDYLSAGAFSQARLVGDVSAQYEHSFVRGGNDMIAGGIMKEDLVGDVYRVLGGRLIGGDDTIGGGEGADQIFGDVQIGDGQSVVTGGDDVIHGGENDDYIYGEGIVAGTVTGGDDRLYGEAGSDTIFGQTGNDTISGGTGADFLNGGAGNDYLDGGSGNDTMNGEDGNDTLDGGAGGDTMNGGAGNDTYFVNDAADQAIEAAGQGIDTVWTFLNSFVLMANAENLSFNGIGDFVGIGNDLGNTITASLGADAIGGRAGNDRLIALAGDDQLHGEDGNDILEGGAGADRMEGGAGSDTANYANAAAGILVDFANYTLNTGEALGDNFLDVENIAGSAFADTLRGDDLANALSGRDGADALFGRGGNDTLAGGAAKDLMSGGTGNDRFDFNAIADSAAGAQRDVVSDFAVDPAAGGGFVDRLDFATIDAKAGTAGDQAFAFIGGGAFTAEGQIRAFQSGANTVLQINTTGANGAEMELTLANFVANTLSAADFIL